MADAAAATPIGQVLVCKAAGEMLVLQLRDVAEIIRPRVVTRIPHAAAGLLGVTNFRGLVLPVISLAKLLGHDGGPPQRSARIVVLDKGAPVGVLVDEISALTTASQEGHIDLDLLLARDFGGLRSKSQLPLVNVSQSEAASAKSQRGEVALMCFVLAGQDYALPLAQVLEVTLFPADIAEVPRTDQAMIGVTTLRSGLVPLVSLHVLLGLPTLAIDKSAARVVYLRYAGRAIGLVTDGIKAILRASKDALDAVPAVLTRGSGEAQIEAICRLEGGGLVSILAPDKLFDAATSARIMANETLGATDMADAAAQSHDEQFVIFQLGNEEYGLPIASVVEVVRRPGTLTRVPRAPAFIEGIMDLRGKMIPVVDQRQRFQITGQANEHSRKVIVMTIGVVQTGFTVDKVSEVLAISAKELKASPQLQEQGSPVFDRIAFVQRDGRVILLVDPKALLDRAEREVLATLAADSDDKAVV